MSTIDNRVVHMEFDNKQFEQGVHITLETLSKLKEALSFKKSGIDELQKSANGVSFAPLSDQVSVVQQRFSLFGELARNVFDRISNKIIDTASLLGRSLTLAPISDGFEEYGLKMGSVQTIMAGTGESLETVNSYLDNLNTYADKTIYSFSDMTQSIGKFTNAGVSLDSAVSAIKGISNEAAVSGANTNEASRAMYNFAQALSSGAVKLLDWRSIELANMGTMEFKNQLIDTAYAMGTLKKEGDKYVSTTTDLSGKVSDAFDATTGFNDSLAHQWMTTDVLVEALSHYSKDVREMSEDERLAYEEKLRSIGYTEDQIAAIEELGIKANNAAKEVKTLDQLIATIKEGLGSGWAQSMEYIFGDFEEAKALWTGVNDEISSILDPIADARNNMLKFWHDQEKGGRTTMIEAIATSWEGVKSIMDTLRGAFQKVFPPITGQTLVDITNHIADMANKFKDAANNSENLKRISDIAKGVFNTFKMAAGAVGMFWDATKPIRDVLGDFAVNFFDVAAAVGRLLTGMTNSKNPIKYFVDGLGGIGKAGERIDDIADGVVGMIDGLVKGLSDLIGIHIEGNPVSDFVEKLRSFAGEHFKFPSFDALKDGVQAIKDTFSSLRDLVSGGVGGVFSGISGIFNNLFGVFGGASEKLDGASTSIGNVAQSVGELNESTGALDGIISFISSIADSIVRVCSTIADYLPKAFDFVTSGNLQKLVDAFVGIMKGSLLNSIRKFFDVLSASKVETKKGGLFDIIETLKVASKEAIGAFAQTLGSLAETLTAFTNSINASALLKTAAGVGILVISLSVLASMDSGEMADGIAGVVAVMTILVGGFKGLDFGSGMVAARAIGTLSWSLIRISIAIGILSVAAAYLSGIGLDKLAVGLIGIGVAMGIMVAGVSGLAKFGGSIETSATTMIALSIAIRILASAVQALSSIPVDTIDTGLFGIAILLAEVVAFSKFVDSNSLTASSATSVLLLAVALRVLSASVEQLSALDAEGQLQNGLTGVGMLLAEIAAFSKFTDVASLSITSAISIVIFAAALKILESSVKSFASMNFELLKQGLFGVGILLLQVGLFAATMNGVSMSLSSIVGIVAIVQAVAILSDVVKSLSEISTGGETAGMEGALGGLTIMLIELVAALKVLGTGSASMLVGAVALTVLSAALRIFLPVIQTLSGLNSNGVAASLITLAFSLTILGVAGAAFGAISGLMLTGAAAIAAFGAACIVAGVGVLALGVGLTTVAAGIAAFGAALAMNIGNIASSLMILGGAMGAAVGYGIVQFVAAIYNGLPQILAAFGAAIHSVGDFIVAEIPYICSIGGLLLTSFIQTMATGIPQLINTIGQFVFAIAQAIITWIPALSALCLAAGITLANSLANGIRDNGPQILAAMRNILSSIIELVITAFADIVRLIPGIGPGLAEKIEGAKDIVRSHLAPESMEATGKGAMDGIVSGVRAGATDLQNASKDAADGVTKGFEEGMSKGGDLATGFTNDVVSSLESASPQFGAAGDENLIAYLTSLGDTELASTFGGDISDANIIGLLSGISGMDAAGNENLNAFLSGFGNTDLAAWTGTGLALSGADGAASASDAYAGAAFAGVASYGDVLSGSDAYAQGVALSESGAAGAGAQSGAYDSAASNDAAAFLSLLGGTSATSQGSTMAQTGAEGATQQEPAYVDAATFDGEGFTSTLGGIDASPQGASLGGSGASGASGTYGSYSAAGSYVASGFNWAIASPYAKALASAKGAELANAALGSIRSTINAASPSKETMKYGRWVSEGFAIGIGELSYYAEQSGAKLGKKTLDALAVSAEAINNYTNFDYDIDPTIRPVLDLTEIQNGVTKANTLVNSIDGQVSLGFGETSYARGLYGGMGPMMANPVDDLVRSINDKLSHIPLETQREGDVNVYINDAIINGDEEIQTAVLSLFDTLTRKGAMNVG